MSISRTVYIVAAAAVIAAASSSLSGQQADEQVTVAFSDPSRPGLVEIHSVNGGMTVKGTNRKDVLVIARPRGGERSRSDAPGGLRRLNQGGGFTVEEERNAMQIESSNPNRTIDFEIQVPARTNLKIEAINNGVITVDGVDGEMELENTNGSILMTNVAGSIVANAVNGRVQAVMTRVTAQKPMAFTTLNGNVDVTLPAATRANLKLRSDMGDVFTDFDMQMLPARGAAVKDSRSNGRGRYEIEVNRSIYGTVNGGGPEIEMRTFHGSVYVRKGS
jgi:DUF4097 and DUF4098 domain-containing protein YvlB